MHLPAIVAALVTAQNNYNATAYAACFSATAVVTDEGHTHTGREAIQHWIEAANQKYRSVMEPVDLSGDETGTVLQARVSGRSRGARQCCTIISVLQKMVYKRYALLVRVIKKQPL